MADLTGLRRIYASSFRVSKIKRRLLQKDLEFSSEFSSLMIKHQILIKQQFQYSKQITAFCYFW